MQARRLVQLDTSGREYATLARVSDELLVPFEPTIQVAPDGLPTFFAGDELCFRDENIDAAIRKIDAKPVPFPEQADRSAFDCLR